MKKKSTLLMAHVLLMVGLALVFGCRGAKRVDSESLESDRDADRSAETGNPSASLEVPDADSKPAGGLAYRLTETKSAFNHAADAQRRKRWPVRMYASGGVGKIVDTNGTIIDQSDNTNFIFGCEVSPDRKSVLIYRGNVDYDLLNLESKEVTRLPARPPGEKMMGFNSWDWVKDDVLLGVSYKVANSRDAGAEPIPERSVLYSYRLSEQDLRRVEVPSRVEENIVHVHLVDDLGNVQLQSEKAMDSRDTGNLAWFTLKSKE